MNNIYLRRLVHLYMLFLLITTWHDVQCILFIVLFCLPLTYKNLLFFSILYLWIDDFIGNLFIYFYIMNLFLVEGENYTTPNEDLKIHQQEEKLIQWRCMHNRCRNWSLKIFIYTSRRFIVLSSGSIPIFIRILLKYIIEFVNLDWICYWFSLLVCYV